MIKKEQMMPYLLESCPDFEPKWKEFLVEWEDEKDDLPLYICLSEFARHLISKLEIKQISNFGTIFNAIERLHIEGDSYVKEAITVGLLEDLQNSNIHNSTKSEDFRPYLLPETERWWNKVDDFWKKGKTLTDD